MSSTFRKIFSFIILLLTLSVVSAQSFEFLAIAPAHTDSALTKTFAVAINSSGNIYLADEVTKSIHIYDQSGNHLRTINSLPTDAGPVSLKSPMCMTIGKDDILYVYDNLLGKIIVSRKDGSGFSFGERGSEPGQLDKISGIAVDSKGYYYLLNTTRKQVDIFSPEGIYITWINGALNIPFDNPVAIGINGADEIYVLEKKGPSVIIFDVTGNLVTKHRDLSVQPGIPISKAIGMAVLGNGDFFILDGVSNAIIQYDKIGNILGSAGSRGMSTKGVFDQTVAICSNSENRLAVLDGAVNKAQVVSVASKSSTLSPKIKRMQLVEESTTRPIALDLVVAPNDYRYAIISQDGQKVIAYRDTSNNAAFVIAEKIGEPVALAADATSNLYVVDGRNKEMWMFDQMGVLIRKFGKDIPEKLKDPVSIAIQSNGNIIVADRSQARLHMWNRSGVYQKIITSPENSAIESPAKIQIDSKDQIYVWDDKQNEILRIGATGWPTAIRKLQVRGIKPGEKAGEIGGFFIDPLDQIHVFNKTNSQHEVYVWDLEPVMKLSIGYQGSGLYSLNNVNNILFDKEIFRIYFIQNKNTSQKVFQFLVKPPIPDNTLTFSVDGGVLEVYFNKLKSRSVVAYGLLTTTEEGLDSLVSKTTTMMVQLDEKDQDLSLHHYGLVSISRSDYSEPTSGFDNYFGYGNRLLKAQRYEEGLSAYQTALDKMGRPKKMVEYISSQLVSAGLSLSQNAEVNRALPLLRNAYTLTPDDANARKAYRVILFSYFQQMSNREDMDGIISEAERMIVNAGLRPIVLDALDSLSISLSTLPSENSINNGILIQKKLISWDPENYSFYGSLSATNYELYKFKSISGAPGAELDVILNEADKYGRQAVSGLRKTKKPYFGEHIVHLEIINVSEKFADVEKQALTELAELSTSLSSAYVADYRTQLARAYIGQKHYDLAVAEYKKVLTLEPDNRSIQEALGEALIENSNYDEAKLWYKQLLMSDRENAYYIAQIGKTELFQKNYAEASFQLEKAIKQDPSDRSFYGPLADAFYGSSNFKRALENYNIAAQYQEDKLTQVRKRMKSETEVRETQNVLIKYLEKVAQLNELAGNHEASINAYNKLLEFDQSNAEAFYNMGKTCISAGLIYDGVEAFSLAWQLDLSNENYSNAYTNALNLRDKISKNEAPLNIMEIQVREIFPSLYRNYSDVSILPVGEIVVANNTALPITPVSIKVFVKELMSQPTFIKAPALIGYSNNYIKLTALFTDKILNYTDDQTLPFEVEIEYINEGKSVTIKKSSSFVLHGRNAISWADKRRLGSFISPNVEELIDYNRKADNIFRDIPQFGLNKKLLKAMQIYTLLNDDRFVYSPDPAQSFATVSVNTEILDRIQYPAETLKKKSGDCDDLVAVYAALLENAGISTAYVDVPGHVFMAFDCEIKPDEIANYGLKSTDVIILYGKVWVPIETTLLSKQNFMLAWASASARYYKELTAGNFPEVVPLAEARAVYSPSSYVPEGYSEEPSIDKTVLKEYSTLVSELLAKTNQVALIEMESRYHTESGNLYVKNKYATLLAQIGESERAEKILYEALELSPDNSTVLNNLGNIYYLRGDSGKAIEYYLKASEIDRYDGEVLINLCKAYLLAGNKAQAKSSLDKATSLDTELAYIYDYLKNQVK